MFTTEETTKLKFWSYKRPTQALWNWVLSPRRFVLSKWDFFYSIYFRDIWKDVAGARFRRQRLETCLSCGNVYLCLALAVTLASVNADPLPLSCCRFHCCVIYEVSKTDSAGLKVLINLSFYWAPQTIVASYIATFSNSLLDNWFVWGSILFINMEWVIYIYGFCLHAGRSSVKSKEHRLLRQEDLGWNSSSTLC